VLVEDRCKKSDTPFWEDSWGDQDLSLRAERPTDKSVTPSLRSDDN
jgi:hypothetical protein